MNGQGKARSAQFNSRPEPLVLDEAAAVRLREMAKLHPDGWGCWTLNAETRLLSTKYLPDDWHSVRVAEILHDTEFLYIVLHLSNKSWVSAECLGHFVRAGEDIRSALYEWVIWS